jgi:sRNA-binding regulator protein Hfq
MRKEERIAMSKRVVREKSTPETASTISASTALLDPPPAKDGTKTVSPSRKQRTHLPPSGVRSFAPHAHDEHASNRQAELFYLQKQIQLQTQMVFILEDGTRIQGVVEWYDRNSIKVRGKSRVLIYKSAIKYLYKAGEIGTAPEE